LKRASKLARRLLFPLKWKFMTPEKKYAYLWARTLRAPQQTASSSRHDATVAEG